MNGCNGQRVHTVVQQREYAIFFSQMRTNLTCWCVYLSMFIGTISSWMERKYKYHAQKISEMIFVLKRYIISIEVHDVQCWTSNITPTLENETNKWGELLSSKSMQFWMRVGQTPNNYVENEICWRALHQRRVCVMPLISLSFRF